MISVYDGMGARYLLRSGVLDHLLADEASVVILSPNADEDYFRQEFGRSAVTLERLDLAGQEETFHSRAVERFFKVVRVHTMSPAVDTSTLDSFLAHYRTRQRGLLRSGYSILVSAFVRLLRRSRRARAWFSRMERSWFTDDKHDAVFQRHRPDVLVTTTMGNSVSDAYLLRAANRLGIRTVTVILSWDNTSKWGLPGAHVDDVAVWSDMLARDLVEGHDVDRCRIHVTGPPHFDIYTRPSPSRTRCQFFAEHGLDAERRLLLFGTKAPQSFPHNGHIARELAKAIMDGRLAEPCHLWIRLHPQYFRAASDERDRGAREELVRQMEAIREWCPFVYVNRPTILSDRLNMDMATGEMDDLHALMVYSNVLINPFSTLNIEACIHDLPTINVGFDGDGVAAYIHAAKRSIAVDERHAHNQRILRLGFTRVARNSEELVALVNRYLRDPSLERAERRLVVVQEGGPLDGRSAERVAHLIQGHKGSRHV